MKPNHFLWVVFLFSSSLLVSAMLFQYVGGLPPCYWCYIQRYAHIAVIIFAVVGLVVPYKKMAMFIVFLALLVSTGVAGYHVGIEQGFWGSSCASMNLDTSNSDAFLQALENAPIVKCDAIAWEFIGISMAGWNMILSFVMAMLLALALGIKKL